MTRVNIHAHLITEEEIHSCHVRHFVWIPSFLRNNFGKQEISVLSGRMEAVVSRAEFVLPVTLKVAMEHKMGSLRLN